MNPPNLSKDQFKEILGRYIKGQSKPHEERFIEQWYNALGKESWVHLDEAHQKEMEDKLWNAISSKIKSGDKPNIESTSTYTIYWKVASLAATLLIGFSAFLYFNYQSRLETADNRNQKAKEQTNIISNETNTVREVSLEDGTLVALQPQSKLNVKIVSGTDKREVYLEGEAFFEVAHDKTRPFYVYTGNITTRVLGTSFNVSAKGANKTIEVAVKTGKVSVTKTKQKSSSPLHILTEEIILTPNQKAIYNKGGDEVLTALVDNPKRIPVKGSELVMEFDEEPVSNILAAIEDAYGVDIVFDEEIIRTCTLTTSLSDEGLYDRLSIICKAIRGTYELNGTQVIIRSKGCVNN